MFRPIHPRPWLFAGIAIASIVGGNDANVFGQETSKPVVTITLSGDTGSDANRSGPPFSEAFERIAPEVNGELNLVNVEGVITNRGGLPRKPKPGHCPSYFIVPVIWRR